METHSASWFNTTSDLQHIHVLLCVREDINNEPVGYPGEKLFQRNLARLHWFCCSFSQLWMVKHPSFTIILTLKSHWNYTMCCYNFRKPLSCVFSSLVPASLAGLTGVNSLWWWVCASAHNPWSMMCRMLLVPVWNRNSLAEELWRKSEGWIQLIVNRILPCNVWERQE